LPGAARKVEAFSSALQPRRIALTLMAASENEAAADIDDPPDAMAGGARGERERPDIRRSECFPDVHQPSVGFEAVAGEIIGMREQQGPAATKPMPHRAKRQRQHSRRLTGWKC
jgi:hypothetical protein